MPRPKPAGGAWSPSCQQGRRQGTGRLRFQPRKDATSELKCLVASFCPTATPAQVLQAGAFGGTYFRDISSAVTGERHTDAWAELPRQWIKSLDISAQLARPWSQYDARVNKYGAKCGNTLEEWETSGWIKSQDPYGWFQWYCRFFQGRRTEDDARQISRWLKVCGPTGRWKGNLIAKCLKQGRRFNDPTVAPAVRQSLLHWAYELTEHDFNAGRAALLAGKGAAFMAQEQLKEFRSRPSGNRKLQGRLVAKRPAGAKLTVARGEAAKRRRRA